VIPNGPNQNLAKINIEIVKKTKEKYSLKGMKLIFSIGRLLQSKRFQYLIEAMPYIISRFPNTLAFYRQIGSFWGFL